MMKRILLFALATIGMMGCESSIAGNEGQLMFSYETDDDVFNFNKPIAVGAALDLTIQDFADREDASVIAATTKDPDVIDVLDFRGNQVTLVGTGTGNTLVKVSARDHFGDELDDSVNMLAREAEVLRMQHTCDDAVEAHYLSGHRILIPFEIELLNGNPLIGYGFYPVTDDPVGLISIDRTRRNQQFIIANTADDEGTVSLHSDIDGTRLDLTIVHPERIDGATLPFGTPSSVPVGGSSFLWVLPTAGGQPICQAIVQKSAVSNTPDVCTVSDSEGISDDTGGGSHELGWVEVEGHQNGTCQFTVTYDASGQGSELSVQIR